MSNKNSTQIALPFDLKGKEVKPYVAQHFNITFARQKNVGIMAKKIMTNVMAQIKRDDKDFKSFYQLHITDLVDQTAHLPSVYKEAKKAFNQLTDLKWLIEDLENKRFAFRHLLNTSDAKCGYNDGTITVVLNPLLKDYFIEMAHYTTYDLKWSMTFSSWYSMRLFEILSAFKDTGVWWVSISEYRKLMDCEDKYPEQKDLIKKTTEKALLELEPTNMAFTFKPVLDENHQGRGRKPTIALEFILKKAQPKIKAIPNDWFTNPEHAKLLEKMKKRYELSEVNITKYSGVIGLVQIRKLLQSWDIKEASADPIKNKLFYCNKVFVAMGKATAEAKI
jgi:plasmid replication initiation protein